MSVRKVLVLGILALLTAVTGCTKGTTPPSKLAPERPKLTILMFDDSESSIKDFSGEYQRGIIHYANAMTVEQPTVRIGFFVNRPRYVIQAMKLTDPAQLWPMINAKFSTPQASSERGTWFAPLFDSLSKACDELAGYDVSVLIFSDGLPDDPEKGKIAVSAAVLASKPNLKALFIGPVNDADTSGPGMPTPDKEHRYARENIHETYLAPLGNRLFDATSADLFDALDKVISLQKGDK